MSDFSSNSCSCPKLKRIAIVGGGISGLAAAVEIREKNPNASISVFDKRSRLGGVLHTEIRDGFEIEQAADNFITTVPWGVDLCRKLGLESELVTTTPRHRQTFVVWRNRLCKLPDGFMMMAPTQWWPMAVTSLLSPWGKVRAGMELFVPARRDDEDESMEQFAVRRLGREVFDRLIEPLVSGVYAADMSKLSIMATLPRFREMEKKYGSLILAMRANRRAAKKSEKKSEETVQSGPRYSMFVTVKGGLTRLIDAAGEFLNSQQIFTETEVSRMTQLPMGWQLAWTGKDGQEKTGDFDAVILATESHAAAKLLKSAGRDTLAELLGGIEHTDSVVVTAAYRREQVGHPLDGMGAVVPAVEKNPILALSFSSEKYPHRAPAGHALIRIFGGGARDPELVSRPESEIKALLLEKTASILKIQGEPEMVSLSCWPQTMPQLHLGHLERIEKIQTEIAALSDLALAGNFFSGVGIPQCVRSGQLAAEKVLNI